MDPLINVLVNLSQEIAIKLKDEFGGNFYPTRVKGVSRVLSLIAQYSSGGMQSFLYIRLRKSFTNQPKILEVTLLTSGGRDTLLIKVMDRNFGPFVTGLLKSFIEPRFAELRTQFKITGPFAVEIQ